MSSIWHTKNEKATEGKTVFAKHKSIIRDGGIDWFIWEPQEFTDAIREDVIAWTYLDDLLALETELDRTRKALGIAVDALKYANKCIKGGCVSWETEIDKALEQITALEQKDVK